MPCQHRHRSPHSLYIRQAAGKPGVPFICNIFLEKKESLISSERALFSAEIIQASLHTRGTQPEPAIHTLDTSTMSHTLALCHILATNIHASNTSNTNNIPAPAPPNQMGRRWASNVYTILLSR